jgi:hypothetical protein
LFQQSGCTTACSYHTDVKPRLNGRSTADVFENIVDDYRLTPRFSRPGVGTIAWEFTKRVNITSVKYVEVECTPVIFTLFFADEDQEKPQWILMGQVLLVAHPVKKTLRKHRHA